MDVEKESEISSEENTEIVMPIDNMETDASSNEITQIDTNQNNLNIEIGNKSNNNSELNETLKNSNEIEEDCNKNNEKENDKEEDEEEEEEDEEEGVMELQEKHETKNSKRPMRDSDWLSDDDGEFAGFSEHHLEDLQHQSKKIKVDSKNIDEYQQITEENVPAEELDEQIKTSTTTTPTVPLKKGGRIVPLSDPVYKKPFEYGWKRELVLRANPETSKDKGEVYYIAPNGKRLRTRNEIYLNLPNNSELTLANFTFSKETIGMSPDIEIIRNAKIGGGAGNTIIKRHVEVQDTITTGKRIPKPKAPKGVSPPPLNRTPLPNKTSRSTPQQNKRGELKDVKSTDDGVDKPQKSKQSSNEIGKKRTGGRTPKRNTEQINFSSDGGSLKSSNNVISIGVNRSNTDLDPMSEDDGIPTEYSTFFTRNFFTNISNGYDILLHIFQYLKVQELLRAGCVSRMWYYTANNPILWRTVRMKNSQVNDWNGLAATLIKNGTKHLDLRKMLSSKNNSDKQWSNFSNVIGSITNLESIDLCKCSVSVVEKLFETNPNLKILNAITLKDETLNLKNIENLKNLTELRLKSSVGLVIEDLTPLKNLKKLKHLSLTSVKELGEKNSNVLGELSSLESLELGECSELTSSFVSEVLNNLTFLKRLRLERGQDSCPTFEILTGISKMEHLTQLELINFDIRSEFDDCLSLCTNIKKLLLIPTYVSQSATTNQIVLNGVMKLSKTLNNFTWAVTSELVRVTELYVDNCDANKRSKKTLSDCIPVLKPVPGILESTQIMSKRAISEVPQVEILPLTSVEKILNTALPQTKVHMIIIAYHATWRQNLVEN